MVNNLNAFSTLFFNSKYNRPWTWYFFDENILTYRNSQKTEFFNAVHTPIKADKNVICFLDVPTKFNCFIPRMSIQFI